MKRLRALLITALWGTLLPGCVSDLYLGSEGTEGADASAADADAAGGAGGARSTEQDGGCCSAEQLAECAAEGETECECECDAQDESCSTPDCKGGD